MNWEAIAATAETLGAIAVLVTILFLAKQMSQTNRGQNATAFVMWAQMRIELSNAFAQPEIADIVARGLFDPSSLSSDKRRLVFHNHLHQYMIVWEVTYQLWRKGLLDEADWAQAQQMISEVKGAPVFEMWWSSVQDYYGADFIEVVNSSSSVPSGYELFVKKLSLSGAGNVDDA